MGLLISVLVAAVIAIVVFVVATSLVSFAYSGLIFGLLALALFLILAFGSGGRMTGRGRWY